MTIKYQTQYILFKIFFKIINNILKIIEFEDLNGSK